jgi:hypothetical protein
MRNRVRKLLHPLLPAHFNDPIGLFARLLRSKDPAALFTIGTTTLSALASPLDFILHIAEKRFYQKAPAPNLPLIFVTGPPRSGTSLVAQVLIQYLPVSYFNNLTAVFQRAPILANVLFAKISTSKKITYKSYYGKTNSFSGPNDGLHIWDRWFGKDRTRIPTFLGEKEKHDMIRFFGAYQNAFQKPFLNKNNNLNTFAHLVAEALRDSHFICLTREAPYLAQSLLTARTKIHGDKNIPYGLHHQYRNRKNNGCQDYVEDVCRQVLFHEKIVREQQQMVGANRFWIVEYEQFCEKPEELVQLVSQRVLRQPLDVNKLRKTLKPLQCANIIKSPHELFHQIQSTLEELRAEKTELPEKLPALKTGSESQ